MEPPERGTLRVPHLNQNYLNELLENCFQGEGVSGKSEGVKIRGGPCSAMIAPQRVLLWEHPRDNPIKKPLKEALEPNVEGSRLRETFGMYLVRAFHV